MLMNGLNVIEFLPYWIKGAMVCLDVLHIVQKGQIVHTNKKKKRNYNDGNLEIITYIELHVSILRMSLANLYLLP